MELKKRIAIVFLCLIMLFSAACAAPKTETETKSTTETKKETPVTAPTVIPTGEPTRQETAGPTTAPTADATTVPTAAPTGGVTTVPTSVPTGTPTVVPTTKPGTVPTAAPTTKPTAAPTAAPTTKPTTAPITAPTTKPTIVPTAAPTTKPTTAPTVAPTTKPTTAPTNPVQMQTYTDEFGVTYEFPVGSDFFDYTLSQANLPAVTSQFPALEKLIYEKTNAERAKQGLAPLTYEENAYYFANTRAYEASVLWDHTRPNGKPFYHVFAEQKVLPSGCGENLYNITYTIFSADYIASPEGTAFVAESAINGWMNSPGHRANILEAHWNSMVVGVYYDAQTQALYAVQLFFA